MINFIHHNINKTFVKVEYISIYDISLPRNELYVLADTIAIPLVMLMQKHEQMNDAQRCLQNLMDTLKEGDH